MIVSAVVFVPFALQFIAVWRNDRRHLRNDAWLENLVWGATLVRVYFGFNELGHATEKIFAGYHSWSHMTNDVFAPFAAKTFPPFTLLSSAPGLFVIIAGLIEFALAIGIGFGFMTRLAGAGGVLFLLIATIGYGKEWFNGYGWAGAGWEYVMLLIVFFISFVFTGAGKFSIDSWLLANNLAPKWLIPLGFTKSGRERFEAQSTKIADYAKQYAPHSTTARF
jgi:putative oxidoreductase